MGIGLADWSEYQDLRYGTEIGDDGGAQGVVVQEEEDPIGFYWIQYQEKMLCHGHGCYQRQLPWALDLLG